MGNNKIRNNKIRNQEVKKKGTKKLSHSLFLIPYSVILNLILKIIL